MTSTCFQENYQCEQKEKPQRNFRFQLLTARRLMFPDQNCSLLEDSNGPDFQDVQESLLDACL